MSPDVVCAVLEQTRRDATLRVEVGFAHRSLVYSTNAPDHLSWLHSYAAGQFRITEASDAAAVDVSSYEDPAFELAIRRRLMASPNGLSVSLYQHYPAVKVDLGAGWTALVHTSRPCIVVASPSRQRCVTLGTPDDPESKLEPIRCLREIFTKTIEHDGYFVFHAGAVAIGGHGIAVCGPKGAGKSTTVIGMAESGASFLANDRAYLGPLDEPWIHPWPTTSAIGMGTLYHHPGLRSWLKDRDWDYRPQDTLTDAVTHERLVSLTPAERFDLPDKLQLTSGELARSVGTVVALAAPLSCFVLPSLDLRHPEFTVEDVPTEAAAEMLASQCFTPHDDGYPDWLGWRSVAEDQLRRDAGSLVSRLAEEIPFVRVRFADLRGRVGSRLQKTLLEFVSRRDASTMGYDRGGNGGRASTLASAASLRDGNRPT